MEEVAARAAAACASRLSQAFNPNLKIGVYIGAPKHNYIQVFITLIGRSHIILPVHVPLSADDETVQATISACFEEKLTDSVTITKRGILSLPLVTQLCVWDSAVLKTDDGTVVVKIKPRGCNPIEITGKPGEIKKKIISELQNIIY